MDIPTDDNNVGLDASSSTMIIADDDDPPDVYFSRGETTVYGDLEDNATSADENNDGTTLTQTFYFALSEISEHVQKFQIKQNKKFGSK